MDPADIPKLYWTPDPIPVEERPKVLLSEATVRMRQGTSLARGAVSLVNTVLETSARATDNRKGTGRLSITLARYDDDLVAQLEDSERRTRPSDGEGYKSRDSSDATPHGVFVDGKWDRGKMVKTFARMDTNQITKLPAEGTE